jgi:hypothetical protein
VSTPLPLLADEGAESPSTAPKTSELEIEVLEGGDGIGDVRVAAEHIESASPPFFSTTGSGGEARLENLPYGHYVFSFQTADGRIYVGNRALLVGPKRDEKGTFVLGPFQSQDDKLGLSPGMDVPAFEGEATGVARLEENLGPTGWAWLRTGRGVALVVGGGTLIVAALIASAEDDDEVQNDDDDVSPSEVD